MNNDNKAVLITGASRGIGKAIAEKFLSEGYKVYGTYFSSKEKIIGLENKYGKDKFVVCGPYDFKNLTDTDKFIESLSGLKFNAIICSAGMFSENDDFLNFDLTEFEQTMHCNFYSPLMISIKLQNNLMDNGSIVIMSSNDAYSGAYGSVSYSISKTALLSLTKCLCVNYGGRGIRVNSVAPGAINTDMNTPEQEFDAPGYTPINRIGQPTEVAEVVYFLSSPNASFINGENITIDGGYTNVSVLLQNESLRARGPVLKENSIAKGYNWLFQQFKEMQKGDVANTISMCNDYEWIDTPEEIQFAEENLAAAKRGGIINRILICEKDRLNEIKESNIIKRIMSDKTGNIRMYFITKEELIKSNPEDLLNIGSGFELFGNTVMIDYTDKTSDIGYIVNIKSTVDKYQKTFNNIFENYKR